MPVLHVTHSPCVPGDPWREPVRILDSRFFLSYLVFIDGRYSEAARHVVAREAVRSWLAPAGAPAKYISRQSCSLVHCVQERSVVP